MSSHRRVRRIPTPSTRRLAAARALVASLGLAVFATLASAQASVLVQLKDKSGNPADGEVSLHDKSGARVASCTTVKGECQMSGVAGGLYEVRIKPASGAPSPKPRTAMIPSEGTAKLIVSTGS